MVRPLRVHAHKKGDVKYDRSTGKEIGVYEENDVHFSVSGRRYELGTAPLKIKSISKNDYYLGYVTQYNLRTQTYTIALDNEVQARVSKNAVVGTMRLLEKGDRVSVRITDVKDDVVFGTARKL